MTLHPSRRDFLMKVARTAAYVPPTLVALGSPSPLAAQAVTGKGMEEMMGMMDGGGMGGMDGGMDGGMGGMMAKLTLPGDFEPIRTAPWEVGPPGGE